VLLKVQRSWWKDSSLRSVVANVFIDFGGSSLTYATLEIVVNAVESQTIHLVITVNKGVGRPQTGAAICSSQALGNGSLAYLLNRLEPC
jgi:hypothetical protein